MKKIGILILIILFAFTTFAFAADNTFEKDLQDFVKLVQDNKGWYFEETSYGYMAMYYIDIEKEDYYYISQKRYTLSDMNNKKLRLSSSGGSPYIRDSRILNQEKENFRIENGKVVSILDYDTYLIKTDCKTEAEATAYLSKKINDRFSLIIGNYYDKESGISLSISRQGENFKTTIKYKNGTSKEYEMRFWDSISIVGFEEDAGYFVEIRNGKIRLYSADTGDHVQNLGSFEVPALQKKVKSIETETKTNGYMILSKTPKYVSYGNVLRYSENGVEKQKETVYRVYEKDGWKMIEFADKKAQLIDGDGKSLGFLYTAENLKNDSSASADAFADAIKDSDTANGFLVKNLRASSTLKDKYHTYAAEGMLNVYNVYEDDWWIKSDYWVKNNVPWVEGKADEGIGEYIEFNLEPSTDYRHQMYFIRILNGYVNPLLPHLFKENSRIKTALVETDKGYKDTIEFADVVEFTEFSIPMEKDGPTHVKITIKDVYKGTKYSDTSVTALEVHYKLWEK